MSKLGKTVSKLGIYRDLGAYNSIVGKSVVIKGRMPRVGKVTATLVDQIGCYGVTITSDGARAKIPFTYIDNISLLGSTFGDTPDPADFNTEEGKKLHKLLNTNVVFPVTSSFYMDPEASTYALEGQTVELTAEHIMRAWQYLTVTPSDLAPLPQPEYIRSEQVYGFIERRDESHD